MFHRLWNFSAQAALSTGYRLAFRVGVLARSVVSVPLRRNPVGLAALEKEMSAKDPAKQGQVSDMDPRHIEPIPTAAGATAPPAATLDADLQAHIGRQLRAVYEEVVSEAVPDRLLRLLEELERKQAPRS